MVTGITQIESSHNFLRIKCLFVTVVPKYFNRATISKDLLAIACHDFALQSSDETETYT
jgi:hypothetical protein